MDIQFFVFFILLFLSIWPFFSYSVSDFREGSSFSVENPEDFLISPSGVFSAGFYPVGDNAYCFAIWFSKPFCTTNNCTVVWIANRDLPVNGKRSELLLLQTGNLILTDAGKSIAWSTGTISRTPTELFLHNTGNLVLQNTENQDVLWQSFDSPTDTLLPLQPFTKNMQLVSSRSRNNFSTGFFKLVFDNNLLRLLYDGPEFSSVYWPYPWLQDWEGGRFPYNNSRIAFLDLFGKFTSSDNLGFMSTDYGMPLQRRLTLDLDGNVRLYSREVDSTTWVVSWQSKSQPCEIHGICGANSTCSYDPISGRKCSCLPGFKIKNTSDWTLGCEPDFNIKCNNDTDNVSFIQIRHVEFYGYDAGVYANYSLDMCKKVCSQICNCKGFQYRYLEVAMPPNCYPKISLLNGQKSPSFLGDFYLKVPKTGLSMVKESVSGMGLNCSTELVQPLDRVYLEGSEKGTWKFMLWFSFGVGGAEIIVIFLVWCFLFRSQEDSNEATKNYDPAAATRFKRFTYSELKKATRNFREEIGRGAGGVVYKGILLDNQVVAIKRLNIANQGQAEFLAEVSTIGMLNHMNLIGMLGYCAEGKHRLLVYEYMKHGSLAENLSSNSLDWKKRFEIALGTARGLAYLHEECLEWVLHCDVKPQNILLDSNYQPKVSDFGLSKLLSRGELDHESFSKIRGTRGYMAPEWVFNLPITSKVDVYSYGIVVLEMVTGKSPTIGSNDIQTSGEIEHKRLVTLVRDKKNEAKGVTSWMEEIIDHKLEGEYDKAEMEILVTLALQCVEEDKDTRPTMGRVVEMLLHLENDH